MASQGTTEMEVIQKLVGCFRGLLKESPDRVYFAPDRYPTADTYPSPLAALSELFVQLEYATHFLLYYPEKLPSGSLVELGYALAKGVPCLVLTRDLNNLSYILREGAPNLTLIVEPDLIRLSDKAFAYVCRHWL